MTMAKGGNNNHQQQSLEVSVDASDSKFFDDDGHSKRSGNPFLISCDSIIRTDTDTRHVHTHVRHTFV